MNHYQFPRLDFASDLWHHVAMNYKRGWVAITVLAALMTGADGPKFHVHPERNCKLVSC